MKKVLILGSTGSIGTQTLDVIRRNPGLFEVVGLCAGTQADLLAQQAQEFHVPLVALRKGEWKSDIPCLVGEDAVLRLCREVQADIAVASVVGCAGLPLVMACLEAGMDIALANKESLVVGGDLVIRRARELGRKIIPVDSEHSAIFQCLEARKGSPYHTIHLTASGGPFRGRSREELRHVTAAQALKHPNWSMGAKVTIDSSTLMNKGLEILEALRLFDAQPEQISVTVHPTSIVHSLVEFHDGVVMAQLGVADMRTPIQYALFYPEYSPVCPAPRLDLFSCGALEFFEPDRGTFPCLALAERAAREKGALPATLNAANEVAVEHFLRGELDFYGIPALVESAMSHFADRDVSTVDSVLDLDRQVRLWSYENLGRSV